MRKYFIVIMLLVLLSPTTSAFETSSTNYITNIVIVPGANTISSTNYNTTVLIGQAILGPTGSTNYNVSFGFLSAITIDDTKPVITLHTPTSEERTDRDITISVSVDDVSTITYSLDGGSNTTICTGCISGTKRVERLSLGTHTLIVYAKNTANLESNASVSFRIFEVINGGPSTPPISLPEPEINITNETIEIPLVVVNRTYVDKINDFLDTVYFEDEEKCLFYGQQPVISFVGYDSENKPVYDVVSTEKVCKIPIKITPRPFVYFIVGILTLIALQQIYRFIRFLIAFYRKNNGSIKKYVRMQRKRVLNR